jgi:hypothetical protein
MDASIAGLLLACREVYFDRLDRGSKATAALHQTYSAVSRSGTSMSLGRAQEQGRRSRPPEFAESTRGGFGNANGNKL